MWRIIFRVHCNGYPESVAFKVAGDSNTSSSTDTMATDIFPPMVCEYY